MQNPLIFAIFTEKPYAGIRIGGQKNVYDSKGRELSRNHYLSFNGCFKIFFLYGDKNIRL
jgi:hypothetical protein